MTDIILWLFFNIKSSFDTFLLYIFKMYVYIHKITRMRVYTHIEFLRTNQGLLHIEYKTPSYATPPQPISIRPVCKRSTVARRLPASLDPDQRRRGFRLMIALPTSGVASARTQAHQVSSAGITKPTDSSHLVIASQCRRALSMPRLSEVSSNPHSIPAN